MSWNKLSIQTLLDKNDTAVCRAVVAIYKRQTSQEQSYKATVAHNGRGFTAADAAFFSSLAEQVNKGRTLSPKQIYYARKGIRKYWKQLVEIANTTVKEAA